MTQETPTNPFHPEAVATYGRVTRTCEDLGYMRDSLEELNQYLSDYDDSKKQYGTAIGLRGEYGSGKTHLLAWLSQKAEERKHIKPMVIYAKVYSASFFDLYTQLLSQLSREQLQHILGKALLELAKEQAGKLKATQSIVDIMNEPENLAVLNKEKNIDLGQLSIQLRNKLKDPDILNETIPGVIPQMLTLIGDPSLGDMAYQWLLGNEVLDLKALGLNHHLRQLWQEQQGSFRPAITALKALETVAALFRIAKRPLIILIDQLEVLLNDKVRLPTLSSLFKIMIEQLNSQKVLTFIAGVDGKSWNNFPPDVTARLRSRELLQIGNLSLEETKNLLESYTKDLPSQFDFDAIRKIHLLSGGNPREIIRIAYYVYEDKEVEGKLSKVNENILIRSANKSCTIANRHQLALEMADSILNEFGNKVLTRLDVGKNVLLDRLLINDDQPRLALITLKATDKLSEINSAKQFNIVREYLENTHPSTSLIAVAVGYSSEEIRNLLGETGTVLQFDRQSFVGQLNTKITELLAQQLRGVKKVDIHKVKKVDVRKKEVFVSYSWGGESEDIVNQLERALQEKEIPIIRDKRELGLKKRIKAFMERIGRGKCVIVVISQKYLQSENCMFELIQIAKNNQFYERIFPIVLDDAKIYKPLDRLQYVKYWEKQIRELDAGLKEVSAADMMGFREDIDLYTEIRHYLPRLTNILKDMNTRTAKIHTESGFEELIEAIEQKLAE